MRTVYTMNEEWHFSKLDKAPVCVNLPHTWNAEDGQDGGNDYWRGTAMYCKGFAAPPLAPREQVWLEFLGAAMTAKVSLNGKTLLEHSGGYSTFRVNLTDHLEPENLLCVTVDNSANDRVYPQKADFTFYGGLYRGVQLIVVPAAHFALGYHGGPGIKVTPVVHGNDAEVTVEAWVEGPGREAAFEIAGKTQTAPVEGGKARTVFSLPNVHLWDGLNDPYLYTVTARLDSGDEISARFGCRSFQMDPQRGFLLNGREYPLRGVARHQDRKGLGNALTKKEHEEDLAIIREMGANTIRLAHYQHAQEFYDLCDECGMVVWAEIPYITSHMENGRENTLSQMTELVVQNYNHPSIVCWGLSNEITASGQVTEDLLENHRQLNDLCHKLDSTRPTTMANVFMLETDSPLLEIPDLNSYNLYFGWYLGELTQNDSFFDEYHRKFPERPIGFSEYGADANPAYQTSQPERGDYTEQYQCIYHEYILHMIIQRPWLWATHVWNMFDFAADGRDEGGKHGENQKGLVTFDRKLKKDAFYLYKAYWSKEPFVHLCGRRYVNRAEDTTEIKVYSNQRQVKLFVDGELFASQEGESVFLFEIPLTDRHTVEAVAGQCRDKITIQKVETPDKSYRLEQTGGVINWFDKEKLKPGYYSVRDTLGELQENPQAAEIVNAIMAKARASRGDVAKSTSGNANLQKMMAGMSLQSLLKQAGPAISRETALEANRALQKIKKN